MCFFNQINKKILNLLYKCFWIILILLIWNFMINNNTLTTLCFISDNKEIIDPLVYIALMPEIFLIGLNF